MKAQIVFSVADFKALVAAVTKYPNVGAFAESEVVSISIANSIVTAVASGMVLARVRVASAEGTTAVDPIGVSGKDMAAFASVCPEGKAAVKMWAEGNEVLFVCGNREFRTPLAAYKKYPVPVLKDLPAINVTKPVADAANYLSGLAFADTSRAELCCVLFTAAGQAIACDQRTLAVLKSPKLKAGTVAVPVTLAKALSTGDTLYVGPKDTVVKSGGMAEYSMPTLVKAQKEFPLAKILEIGKLPRKVIVSVDGAKLGAAVTECATALAARTETVSTLSVVGQNVTLRARNGGATYRQDFKAAGAATEPASFTMPLESVVNTVPFLTGKVDLSRGINGELFFESEGGWIQFSFWKEKKK